ncbi:MULTISPECIES: NAD(P)-dependent oxidoreductase [unclassified Pseudomonas]|uniref:NAD(P)-dependent oxidoreductase n=1 Tax=unclassified Pseudomonas TaxID=196821 RepID=UPI000C8842A0|nr:MULTISPECIES: NAD(P)-dependent oxidoreductase [unclassified Pseudomonas]PMZ99375.1 3-beta hydroxysteroid dehydrogenase [Pseudomonas sp. FW305-42]PNA23236.1 3-beta hydroxysteroid dehydrogenase [Pseudomonas sp. MPR-R1B]PNB25760.1 3-beta hydroxysteroid dehydrogenase [Pseudomonas sp. DP16D-E2]PNB40965.1 3-beta hydroxysteroid dehydrogenase [Pseudomonas sp. FW305-17]PNB60751.1 3-beta hydroxysteroid dehydrogenase [Pseudomonas sp. GW531-E2]
MSKIAIIGATGRAGSQLLEEALRRGHSVVAIARNPSALQGRDGVTVKALDAKDSAALQVAVTGCDAVLSAAHFSTIEPGAIIESVKRAGVKRLLVVGGAGSLLLPSGHRVIDSPDFPEAYKAEANAGVRFLDTLRQEPTLDWTFLSPSAEFVEGQRSGHYTLGKDHLLIGADGKSWITFADYAIAMLDELEKPAHSRARFTVGY